MGVLLPTSVQRSLPNLGAPLRLFTHDRPHPDTPVLMVIETGKPIAEVARDLGIHDGTLGNWVNAWRREHPEPDQALPGWSVRA
jgi:hypothetical protein